MALIDLDRVERILVIKLRYVGDVLLTTPAIGAIRRALPGRRLSVLVNAGTEEVLRHNPDLDEILPFDRAWMKGGGLLGRIRRQSAFIREIRCRRYDLVIDLSWGDRSAVLTFLSGAKIRVGFDIGGVLRKRLYYTHPVPHRLDHHLVVYHLEAIRALGFQAEASAPRIYLTEEERIASGALLSEAGMPAGTPYVLIHPGARWRYKSWPADRFAALADDIQQTFGRPVLFVGGRQEVDVLEQVRSAMRSRCYSLGGKTSLRQLAALTERADLFIGNDSGPMHLAAAVQTPTVALFGPTDPKNWGPCGVWRKIYYRGDCCRPTEETGCTRGEANCLMQISLHEVIEGVREALQSVEDRPSEGSVSGPRPLLRLQGGGATP